LYIPPFYKKLSQLCSGRLHDLDELTISNILKLNANTLPSDPTAAVARYWDAWWLADGDPTGTLQSGIALYETQVSAIL
jgi:hypothetical protein